MDKTANKHNQQTAQAQPEMGAPTPAPRMPMPTPEVPDPDNAHAPASPKEILTKAADDKLRSKADSLDDKAAEKDTDKALQGGKNKRSFVSKGEKAADVAIYGGIDWLFNTLSATTFTMWAAQTKAGQKYWSSWTNKIISKGVKGGFKLSGAKAEGEAFDSAVTSGAVLRDMIVGGMMTIPPLMWLERGDNKRKITKYFDKKIYGEEAVEKDPKFAKAYDEIENAPEKDFGAGMWARAIVLTPIALMIAILPKPAEFFRKNVHTKVAKFSEWTWNKLKIDPKGWRQEKPGFKMSNWDKMHQTLSQEYTWVPPYAVFHALTYKALAKTRADGKDQKEANNGADLEAMPSDKLAGGDIEEGANIQHTNAHQAHQLADKTAMAEETSAETSAAETLKRSVKTPERPGNQVHKIEAISRQEVRPEIAVN